MPKVIHIVPGKAHINRLNGVNKVVYSIAMEATRAGHATEVWGLAADSDNTGGHPFVFRLFVCNVRRWRLPDNLAKAISDQPADTIFHLHGVMIPLYTAITRLLSRQGRAYIVTPHGALQRRALLRGAWYKLPYIMLFERRVLKCAKAVHCITHKEKYQIQSWCNKAKTRIIPNGTSLLPQSLVLSTHTEPLFLYMGRFDKLHKGLDIALEAFHIFYQQTRQGRFILTGDGPDKDWLKARISYYNLDPFVSIIPPQFGADKDDLLARTDIFIHPSRWDVMPTACLEAAVAGKPLIVSRATGLANRVEASHAGWFTQTHHPSELAQKFQMAHKAWKTGRLRALGQNARTMITDSKLLWQELVKHYYSRLYA